jgi:hypothetical protein
MNAFLPSSLIFTDPESAPHCVCAQNHSEKSAFETKSRLRTVFKLAYDAASTIGLPFGWPPVRQNLLFSHPRPKT